MSIAAELFKALQNIKSHRYVLDRIYICDQDFNIQGAWTLFWLTVIFFNPIGDAEF
jgi:hypothetical protein